MTICDTKLYQMSKNDPNTEIFKVFSVFGQTKCHSLDVDGDIEVDTNGKNTFYLTGGFVYRSGHGREKCSMAKCLNTKEDVPNNCGFHGQFILPNWFKPCGPSCRGGYCLCLRFYDSYLCKYL